MRFRPARKLAAPLRLGPLLIAPVLAGLVACGGGDSAGGPEEKAAKPATPPAGWRTVRNEAAGFTIAAPRSWRAATKRGATLITSKDGLVAVTVAADRSRAGKEAGPGSYARDVIAALPGFEGAVSVRDARIAGSPYETAVAQGSGTVKTSGEPQRIEVAAFHRPGLVTYSAVIFRNARARPVPGRATVARMLRSFRAQPPAG